MGSTPGRRRYGLTRETCFTSWTSFEHLVEHLVECQFDKVLDKVLDEVCCRASAPSRKRSLGEDLLVPERELWPGQPPHSNSVGQMCLTPLRYFGHLCGGERFAVPPVNSSHRVFGEIVIVGALDPFWRRCQCRRESIFGKLCHGKKILIFLLTGRRSSVKDFKQTISIPVLTPRRPRFTEPQRRWQMTWLGDQIGQPGGRN